MYTGRVTAQEGPLTNNILCLQVAYRGNRSISVLVRQRNFSCWDKSLQRIWLLLCAENTSYKLKTIVITCCYKHLPLIRRDSSPWCKDISHMFWLCMWEVSISDMFLLSLLVQNSGLYLVVTSLGKRQCRWHALLISWSPPGCLGAVRLPFARLAEGNNKYVWIVSVFVWNNLENKDKLTGQLVRKSFARSWQCIIT